MRSAGIIGVHTFCVVAVSVFVACSRSFILLNILAHVRISFAHTCPARPLHCYRSRFALSFYCLPSASTYSLYCIAQYMYIRTGSAFVAVRSRTLSLPIRAHAHPRHVATRAAYVQAFGPFRFYSALIHSQAHTIIRAHVPRGFVRSCWSVCRRSFRFGVPFVLVAGILAGIAPK